MNNKTSQSNFFDSWRSKAVHSSGNQPKHNSTRGRGVSRSGHSSGRGSGFSPRYSESKTTPSKRGRGRGRGGRRGRSKDSRFSVSTVGLEDDEDELCHQALGQFELANSDIGVAFAAGLDAKEIPGFERAAGELWIYPTNRPVRDYQFNMVKTALFHNTLVCLPTGLGKTFIAAVVMFNFHRWYPDEIIVFMAPTRPLVTQQLDACHNIVGINPSVTVELTGQTLPIKREALWKEKKVFFLTPQVMQSDITRGSCPAEKVRCVVVDEAHKAVGNHSYAQVISAIAQVNKQFRVLALSATPGNDLIAIQQVFKNLLISRVELRCEDSPDVLPYSHEREVEARVVSLDPFLRSVHEQIKELFQIYTGKLMKLKILPRNGSSFVSFQLLQARQRFRSCPPPQLSPQENSYVLPTFAVCISLAHAIDLLIYHGLRSFYSFLHGILLKEKGSPVVAFELRKQGIDELLTNVQQKLNISIENSSFNISTSGLFESFNEPEPDCVTVAQKPSSNLEDYLQSHPKMRVLKDLVTKHFENSATESKDTKIMIFSKYRDSVQEIGNMLNLLHPGTIKPMVFIGQAKAAGASGRGLKQKEQMQVIEQFKKGEFNVLVATSVGEEGLDIGEVDLIICFDSNKSPTRNVQRMGRTGRQRQGKIIFLLTEGKEERLYRMSVSQQSNISRNITDPEKLMPFLFQVSPRMVPIGLEPECFKMNIILSSEQESYSHKRKHKIVEIEEEDEKLNDDSDFMPPAKVGRKVQKKAKVKLPKKTSSSSSKLSGSKKPSSSSVHKQTENQTLAQCLELMRSRKSQSNDPRSRNINSAVVETITIDEDDDIVHCVTSDNEQPPFNTSYDSQPIVEFHDVMEQDSPSIDDDYEFLCSLFDVQKITAQSTSQPCVQIPLSSDLKINWKEEFNKIRVEDILLHDRDLQCVREKVDACIYVNSLKKYCKCGNVNGSLDEIFDDQDFSDFEAQEDNIDLQLDFETSGQNFKDDWTVSPCLKKTPLTEIQPAAQLPDNVVVKNLFPSPRATVSANRSTTGFTTPIGDSLSTGGAKTSTPLSSLYRQSQKSKPLPLTDGNITMQETTKPCKTSSKTQNEESFDACYMFDENDPFFNEEWEGEMDLQDNEVCTDQSISSNTTRAVTNLHTTASIKSGHSVPVTAATVNDQSSKCNKIVDMEVVLGSDDSSTASESELNLVMKPNFQSADDYCKREKTIKSTNGNNEVSFQGAYSKYFEKEKGDEVPNDVAQILPPHSAIRSTLYGRRETPFRNTTSLEESKFLPSESNLIKNINSDSSTAISPKLSDFKKKFVFKKRTSGNTVTSPPEHLLTLNCKQNVQNCENTENSSSGLRHLELDCSDTNYTATNSNKFKSGIVTPSSRLVNKKKENPHEIFSIYNDDINCIPGTSSDDEDINLNPNNSSRNCADVPNSKETEKLNCNDTDNTDSDETHWDPNERIPSSPSTPRKPSNARNTVTTLPKEDGNSVFSPGMQNFRLTTYRNLSSQTAVTKVLNFLPVGKEAQKSSCHVPSAKTVKPDSRLASDSVKFQNSLPPMSLQQLQPVVHPLRIFPSRRVKLPDSSLDSFNSPMNQPNTNQNRINTKMKTNDDFSQKSSNTNIPSQNSFKCQALQWSSPMYKSSPAMPTGNGGSKVTTTSKFKFKSSSSKLDTSKIDCRENFVANCSAEIIPVINLSPEKLSKDRCLSPTPSQIELDEDLFLLSSYQSPKINTNTPNRSTILLSPGNSSVADSPDFAAFRRKNNVKKRVIHSDERNPNQRSPLRTSNTRVRRNNPFVLHEAEGTSDDSSDLDELHNYGDDGDPFVVHQDEEDEEASQYVSSSQQQAMYLQSVKDVVPVRGGRIENPLPPADDRGLDFYANEYDLNDSFCTTEVEYADVGVYTQCMIAAREQVDQERKNGSKPTRRLRRRR